MADQWTMPDGTVFRVLERPADPETQPLVMEFELAADCAAPPPHVHPGGQTERFECTEGEFELLVGDEWKALPAGEAIDVPPGTRHTFRNRSGAVARVHNVHSPAHSFETYLRRIHAIATETGATSPTSPRVAMLFARLLHDHADTIRLSDPPMRIATGVLGRLGGLLGINAPEPTP